MTEFLSLNIDDVNLDVNIIGMSSAKNPKPGTITFVQTCKGIDFDRLKVAAAVICTTKTAEQIPNGPVIMVVDNPRRAFAAIARALYPASVDNKKSNKGTSDPCISPEAKIEQNVIIEQGAVICKGVHIGEGSYIGSNSVISANCQIGRHCSIGANANIQYTLMGDHVTIHPGACIGQDGFGFLPGETGLEKVPQLGRVIIQDFVEIGANSTVDRGALEDTVIGEGTKIDNLVQIAHNVVIGRHCAIAAFVGLSGSSRVGDGCLLGGRSAIADHVSIGNGVQLAATSSVMNDIPDGEKWAGTPAQPYKAFFREQATLRRMAKTNKNKTNK